MQYASKSSCLNKIFNISVFLKTYFTYTPIEKCDS